MEQMISRRYIGYRQKRSYQTSYAVACVVAYAICIAAALLLTPGGSDVERVRTITLSDGGGQPSGGTAGGDAREMRRVPSGGGLPVEYRSGYVGAIRIVRDGEYAGPSIMPEGERAFQTESVLQPVNLAPPAAGEPGYGTGQGLAYGGGSDPFGLGPSSPYLPPVGGGSPWGEDGSGYGGPSKAWVEFSQPVWPVLADQYLKPPDTGVVVVEVHIRADGTIKYKIVSEEPPEHGFGWAVESALLRSRYHPPEINGKRDSVSFTLRAIMCRGCRSCIATLPAHVDATLLSDRDGS